MRKLVSIIAVWSIFTALSYGQISTDSIVQVILDKGIIEKVEQHEKLVERISWTSPALLVPTVVVILGLAYLIFLQVRGVDKKANSVLSSEAFLSKIDKITEQRIETLLVKKEKEVKNRPVCLIYPPDRDMKDLPKFLKDCGFTNVNVYNTEEDFKIQPNEVLIFNDEDGDFTEEIAPFIKGNSEIKSKGRFFYFGPKRFNDPEIRMNNFANNRDTLAARLYESLSII